MTILIATGLRREARIIARPGVAVIAGGGDARRLEAELEAAAPGARMILSSGLAGALDPSLAPGDMLVGTGEGVDPRLAAWLRGRLPLARTGLVAGRNDMAASAAEKRALHAATGAVAIDMESHVAARVAARHGLPFAIFRVISDAADATLPPAARAGMRPDGGMAVGAVLASLARDPAQLPALIGTAWNAEKGFRALLRGHLVLRLVDLVEHPLDMV